MIGDGRFLELVDRYLVARRQREVSARRVEDALDLGVEAESLLDGRSALGLADLELRRTAAGRGVEEALRLAGEAEREAEEAGLEMEAAALALLEEGMPRGEWVRMPGGHGDGPWIGKDPWGRAHLGVFIDGGRRTTEGQRGEAPKVYVETWWAVELAPAYAPPGVVQRAGEVGLALVCARHQEAWSTGALFLFALLLAPAVVTVLLVEGVAEHMAPALLVGAPGFAMGVALFGLMCLQDRRRRRGLQRELEGLAGTSDQSDSARRHKGG